MKNIELSEEIKNLASENGYKSISLSTENDNENLDIETIKSFFQNIKTGDGIELLFQSK